MRKPKVFRKVLFAVGVLSVASLYEGARGESREAVADGETAPALTRRAPMAGSRPVQAGVCTVRRVTVMPGLK